MILNIDTCKAYTVILRSIKLRPNYHMIWPRLSILHHWLTLACLSVYCFFCSLNNHGTANFNSSEDPDNFNTLKNAVILKDEMKTGLLFADEESALKSILRWGELTLCPTTDLVVLVFGIVVGL